MLPTKIIIIFGIITFSLNTVNGDDKYTDKNRPYEFGFSIDGEQHRHEKKDENGIIMGEFGFITADGVYHVTVYATDENGHFKILSMKNIRVKPYPGSPAQNLRTGHSLALPDAPKVSANQVDKNISPDKNVQQLQTSQTPNLNQPRNEQESPKPRLQIEMAPAAPVESCSHCSLPKSTTIAPRVTNNVQQISNNYQANQQSNTFNNAYGKQGDNIANRQENYQPGQGQVPQTGFVKNNQGNNQAISGINNIQAYSGERNQQSYSDQQYNDNYYQTNANVNGNVPNNNYYKNIETHTGASIAGEKQNIQSDVGQKSNVNYYQTNANEMFKNAQNENQQSIPLNYNNNGQDFQGSNNPAQYEYQTQKSNVPNREIDLPFDERQNDPQTSLPQGNIANIPLSQFSNGERNAKSYEPTVSSGLQTVGDVNLNDYDISNTEPPKTPKLLAAQMQTVDKTADIYHKNPGEEDGLPVGVTKEYMSRVLYVFNYTVGFHGHYEKGFADGSKQGYYYVTGRNGVKTRVDYEADEKGFRPKITNEVLDLLSDEVPKPETEREPQYGLKSYEFKWLYFPEESKQRR